MKDNENPPGASSAMAAAGEMKAPLYPAHRTAIITYKGEYDDTLLYYAH